MNIAAFNINQLFILRIPIIKLKATILNLDSYSSDKVLSFDPAGVSFDYSAVTDYSRRPVRRIVSDISRVFLDTLRTMCRHNCTPVVETAVSIYLATTSADLTLNWITDESYSLETTTKGIERVLNFVVGFGSVMVSFGVNL